MPHRVPTEPRGPAAPSGTATACTVFQAFHHLHYTMYLRYAQVRTGDIEVAARAVERCFAELARRWPEILRSAGPAAMAWRILARQIAPHDGPEPTGAGMARDVRILHRELGVSPTRAADVMGLDTGTVQGLLTAP